MTYHLVLRFSRLLLLFGTASHIMVSFRMSSPVIALVVSVCKDSNGPTGAKLNSNCGGSGNSDTVQISI